jgi:hypothetical protein
VIDDSWVIRMTMTLLEKRKIIKGITDGSWFIKQGHWWNESGSMPAVKVNVDLDESRSFKICSVMMQEEAENGPS